MTQDTVNEIKELALANYDEGGHWVVECFSDQDILEHFNSVKDAREYWLLKQENEDEKQAAHEFYNDSKFWADFYNVKTNV